MSEGEGASPPARPTMRDVAALAGVSFKSVSRVVNDEPGVSPALRERVQRAVRQLDYRHNMGASNLRRSGRTGVIGALLQDVSNSFSSSLLRSLEDTARDRGTVVLAASLDEESARERQLVADLVSRRVDGLVLMPATDRQEYLASERRLGLPVVFVDRTPSGIDADSVTVDNEGGARLATRHLIEHGHTRIALLADLPTIQTAAARIRGYDQAMVDAGLPVDPRWMVTGLRDEAAAAAATTALMELDNPPTALFGCRNTLTVGTARALRSAGLADSVAVVGFDDFPLSDLLTPATTVVRQDVAEIGAEAARMLFNRLDGDTSPPHHTVLEPSLVARGSGEIRS
jgi:LacI family transcriptional regulator